MAKNERVEPILNMTEEASKALDRRNEADYQCFMTSRELLRHFRAEIAQAIKKANCDGEDSDMYLLEDLEAAIEEREAACDAFMAAVSVRK